MENYSPPFFITNNMLEYVAVIMEKIGKINNFEKLDNLPLLIRNNRINSIYSTLSIEANSLSIEEVKDLLSGIMITGPEKDIQEVLNADKAYIMMKDINPYSVNDLKKTHKVMTSKLIEESGEFRKGNEGVFDESGNCIHVCPPPYQIDYLIKELFNWMKKNNKEIHPLILSSVFHYEFVFIHPFSDGNGRTARFWQNAILSKWKGLFEYLPIESSIYNHQQEYYKAIRESNSNASSNKFIEFMLKMINEALDDTIEKTKESMSEKEICINKLLNVMEYNNPMSANEIMNKLGIKSKETLRATYLDPALEKECIALTIPDKPTSKNQKYYKNQ